ncbi:MAG: MFS transporter [Oscillospiraceae bacterium]|jgi:MFS family permease|nr:MFS transporter [Oscillospiraceae bacterium]
MFGIDSRKRALVWTILLIATVQMPNLGLSSGANSIKTAFGLSDGTVQVAMSMPALLSTVSGFVSSFLVRFRVISKKGITVAGIALVGLTGAAAIAFHSSFELVYLYSILIGAGMGAYIPNAQSIAMDAFDEREFQIVAGVQSSFINGGGIVLSLLGGFLISLTGQWSAMYATLLFTVPITFVALKFLPGERHPARSPKGAPGSEKRRSPPLDRNVYRYTLKILVFMLLYCTLSSNISIHIADYGAGDAGTAGVALAFTMAGGVASGFAFPKLSPILRGNMASLSHAELFVSYVLLGLFPSSVAVILTASFIGGLSLSTMLPHCLFSASAYVNSANSAVATMLIGTLAPGTGSFLSPVVITNVTQWLFGSSTSARFLFAGAVSAAIAAAQFIAIASSRRALGRD